MTGVLPRGLLTVPLAIATVLLWILATPMPTYADIFTVTKIADTADGACDSDCSLREAINAADTSSTTPHTIQFAGTLTGCSSTPCTIQLTTSLPPVVMSNVTLNGTGAPGGRVGITPLDPQNAYIYGMSTQGANFVTVRGFWFYGFAYEHAIALVMQGDDHTVVGNYFGNVTGTVLPNSLGLQVNTGARVKVGTPLEQDRNIISGNRIGMQILSTTNATVQNNYIGLGPDGQTARPNYGFSLLLTSANSTLIGGTNSQERNVISGNGIPADPFGPTDGIYLSFSTTNTTIVGNLIGWAADQITPLPNRGQGIRIGLATTLTTIGGTTPQSENRIGNNGGIGISCSVATNPEPACTGALIERNQITANGGPGIDLGNDFISFNDADDSDTGPNNLQNFPEIKSAAATASQTVIVGTLNSRPNREYRIRVYSQAACDPSGWGEGAAHLGVTSVNTDNQGFAAFTLTVGSSLALTTRITATASDVALSETSEFSQCRQVVAPAVIVTPISAPSTSESGGQPFFSVALSSLPTSNVTINLSSSDTTEGTVSPSQVVFTPLNGMDARLVTVTGIDDPLADGSIAYTIVTAAASSSDAAYNGLNGPDVALTNTDNDGVCGSRPPVKLTAVKGLPGFLQVTVQAGQGTISHIDFGQPRDSVNAIVSVAGGLQNQTGDFTFTPSGSTPTAIFTVQSPNRGLRTTVYLAVHDGCGAWRTFVGGGAGSF